MNTSLAAFYLILASCVFGLSIFVSRFIGNLTVLATYLVFIGITFITTTTLSDVRHLIRDRRLPDVPVQYDPVVLYPMLVLWTVFLIGLILNFSPGAFLRAGAFIVLSAVSLFVIPTVVSRKQAFTAIGIIGAVCVGVTLPAILIGDVTIAGRLINWAGPSFSRFGIALHVPATIFDTLNYFRVLVAIGTIASAGVFAHTRNLWMAVICVLNLFGVYVTLGRAARLAIFIAAALAIVYRLSGHRALAGITLAGILATVIGFAVALGVLPGPTDALQSALDSRFGYWRAAYETIAVRPVLGWGLVDTQAAIGDRFAGVFRGVHNSYLRLFVIGGVVGGVAYLILSVGALVTAFRGLVTSSAERAPLALTAFCLVVVALIFQLFAGGTVFGTSLSSVLWAFTIGYAQPTAAS